MKENKTLSKSISKKKNKHIPKQQTIMKNKNSSDIQVAKTILVSKFILNLIELKN